MEVSEIWTMVVPDESLVAGLTSRFLALVFLIHFVSVLPQMRPLLGQRGIEPIDALFRAIRRDLGGAHGFFKYPSLFWLSTSDWMLLAVPTLGSIAALSIISGMMGDFTWIGFLVVWICALSLQTANTNLFWFPWDNLLTETALVGCLLPALHTLPALTAVSGPSPLATLVFSWLLFRVMFGMGLAKFRRWDTRTRAGTYLYHFLEWQPFPCAPAALLRELPMWVHKAGLVSLWCVEIVVPLLIFSTPELRAVACTAFIGLQLVIWWTGNYGTFNLLTLGLSILLLTPFEATAMYADFSLAEPLSVICLFYIVGSIPFLVVTTTWTGASWMYRPSMYRTPSSLRPLFEFYLKTLRVVAPFRIWNSYGVFIPRGEVPHQVAVLQATEDGETWFDLEPKWLSCDVTRKPPRFAPHHPRLDHWLFYQGFGLASLRVSCLTGMNPYYVHPHCLTEKLIQKLLAGDTNAWSLLRNGKVPKRIPRAIRHTAWHYLLNSQKVRQESGAWWTRQLIGVGPPITLVSTNPQLGIRDTFDPLILDRLSLVDDALLCIGGQHSQSFEMLNAYPVQRVSGQKIARSRSVIETITHPAKSTEGEVLAWRGNAYQATPVTEMVDQDIARADSDGSPPNDSIWQRA
ncbi:MAG: lipase maturation factor family protein [Myxococcota bacterium]|nr:lipase maturation factor family protein [Myxococcota bacterium]